MAFLPESSRLQQLFRLQGALRKSKEAAERAKVVGSRLTQTRDVASLGRQAVAVSRPAPIRQPSMSPIVPPGILSLPKIETSGRSFGAEVNNSPFNAPQEPQKMQFLGQNQVDRLKPLEEEFVSSLKPLGEEEALRTRLSNLLASRELGLIETEKAPIPLQAILGEQGRIERRAAVQAGTLQDQLAQLQARRQAALETAKTRFEFEKERRAGQEIEQKAKSPIEISAGATLFDPTTGKQIFQAPAKPTTEAELARLEIAKQGAQNAQERTQLQGQINELKLQQLQQQIQQQAGVTEMKAKQKKERSQRIASDVDAVINRVSFSTAGFGGANLARISGTPAFDLARDIDSIKANIGFNELQEMREASKTGGALGQIAVQELNFLQSTLGSLDIGQSPDQLKRNLIKVKESVQKWNTASASQAGGAESQPQQFRLPDGTIVSRQPDGTYK